MFTTRGLIILWKEVLRLYTYMYILYMHASTDTSSEHIENIQKKQNSLIL